MSSPKTPALALRGIRHAGLRRPSLSGPHWVHWSLLGLLITSAALYSWNIDSSGFSDYYATAAKSMSVSWKAFFFGAFDPQSTITLDKLSGFLVPQALSARIFGFSPWALALPQVIEGLVTISATYYIVSRWLGARGGLIAATFIASTPLLVSLFGHAMEDAMLTMCTTLAIAAWQRCIETDRQRYLILAGVLVGVGFQAKMMQAWLVLPALALVYVLIVRQPWRQALRRILVAGTAALLVSVSWMSVVALVPPSQRPYIDGTTNNDIFTMVLGYNGINRFLSNFVPGALGSVAPPTGTETTSGVGLFPGQLGHLAVKFFLPQYSSQIGWLYPLATAGLILGFVALRNPGSATTAGRELRAGVLLCGALLVTVGTVMSVMSLPHTAYLASLAFPLSALSAIGVVLLWRSRKEFTSRWRFALPVVVAVQTGWTLSVIANYPPFNVWLVGPVFVLGFGAALVFLSHTLGARRATRLVAVAGIAALAGAMLCPVVWSLSTLNEAYAGTANDAYAGPTTGIANPTELGGGYGIGLDSDREIAPTAAIEERIYDYATAHSTTQKYALASDSWRSAAPIIMRGDADVLPIGGFTSRVRSPNLVEVQRLVAGHELNFILLTGQGSKNDAHAADLSELQRWVYASCRLVPPNAYNDGARNTLVANVPLDHLYDCAS